MALNLDNYLPTILHAAYLLAAVLFIFGLKWLSSPAKARRGNRLAALGMGIAVLATLVDRQIVSSSYLIILAGMTVGAIAGTYLARSVPMTAVPQMVALLNGVGGGAAALIAIVELLRYTSASSPLGSAIPSAADATSIALGIVIGSVTFSGSLIAFGKLQGLVSPRAIAHPLVRTTNLVLLAAIVLLGWYAVISPSVLSYLVLFGGALLLGIAMVMPIGGADMPVVISLLNAFTGLAVAATGFVLQNNLLIISGTLVGASGTLLTRLMSKAMNRSLSNVLFGAFGAKSADVRAGERDATIREISVGDAALLLAYARSVIVVPGYGMAVAQAQHEVRELALQLEKRGVSVKFAIHPVAGRMPGHMNVLLAEANVPYSQLYEMDAINPEFERTDVALVIGANDVTNPAARNRPGSPIYGMPILEVDKARHIIVIKRSLRPGFAGIDNDLYLDPKTSMLFGDAKETVAKLVAEIKAQVPELKAAA